MRDIYDGQTYDLKTRVDIWVRVNIVPVEYGTFSQTFRVLSVYYWDYLQVRLCNREKC